MKPLVDDLKAAKADGKVTTDEALDLASDVLAVLVQNNVTLVELADLAKAIGPLLPLLKNAATKK
jgi:hypothetical protein